MKKKFGINIMLFVIILNGIVILSCSRAVRNSSDGSLMKADRAFSEMSVKEGMFKAFLFYLAEDGVILRDNAYPAKGKEDLRKRFEGRSDTSFVLSWEPVYEKISDSGELGYTYGIHTTLEKTSGKITKGTYVTIWRKQSDGSWKFVLDTGTQGLPETER
jgi:ketosteroid isomerase-like protein